jgi:threonine dehydratase
MNKLLSLPPDQIRRGVITASGGNHGLAVAYAAWQAQVPATIYLGHNTPPHKAEKLQQWGATVVMAGAVWDDANRAALAHAEAEQLPYLHPFADSQVIAGQGTLALEILEDLATVDVLLVAIGGGGLISGVALAAKALRPEITIIGVEATGAPTLHSSLAAGQVVTLPTVTTRANTLAPRRTEAINFELVRQYVDDIVLVTDDDMTAAARWLWFEMGVAAELSGAATVAALLCDRYALPRDRIGLRVSLWGRYRWPDLGHPRARVGGDAKAGPVAPPEQSCWRLFCRRRTLRPMASSANSSLRRSWG